MLTCSQVFVMLFSKKTKYNDEDVKSVKTKFSSFFFLLVRFHMLICIQFYNVRSHILELFPM